MSYADIDVRAIRESFEELEASLEALRGHL